MLLKVTSDEGHVMLLKVTSDESHCNAPQGQLKVLLKIKVWRLKFVCTISFSFFVSKFRFPDGHVINQKREFCT